MKKKIGTLKRGFAGIVSDIKEKYEKIPSSTEEVIIGSTSLGRSISAYKIGKGNKSVIFSFGIHGNEVGTVKLAHKVIDAFAAENIPNDVVLYVIPVLNPDGFSVAKKQPGYFSGGKLGRLNSNGVDLNRNFNTKSFQSKSLWSYGKNYSESIEVYAGDRGLSERETKAICNFIKENSIDLWISFHNAGKDVLPSRDNLAKSIAEQIAKMTGFKLLSEKEWRELEQTGTPKEWCEENNITFVEVEGSSRWASDWNLLQGALTESLQIVSKNQ